MPTDHATPPASTTGGPKLRRRLTSGALAVVLAGSALGVAACGSDRSDAAPSTTIGAPLGEIDQTVEATITSSETRLHQAGPEDRVVYGWNLLTGEGTGSGSVHDGTTGVEMLGNVDYVDGNGPFFGFITFDFGEGNTLAVRMDGVAHAATDTSDAAFEADLEVIGGTGDLIDASGTGRFEGSRPDRLGGAVQGTYTFDLL